MSKKYFGLIVLCLLWMSTGSKAQMGEVSLENFKETVWLNADRQLLLAGEKIQLSAEVLELDSYLPSSLSHFIRVELISSSGEVHLRNIQKVNASKTNFTLQLPSDIPSGWYYIRAYTQWMRNASPEFYGLLPIKVFQPNGPLPPKSLPNSEPNTKQKETKLMVDVQSRYIDIRLNPDAQKAANKLKVIAHRSYTVYVEELFSPDEKVQLAIRDLPESGVFQISILTEQNEFIAGQLISLLEEPYKTISIPDFQAEGTINQRIDWNPSTLSSYQHGVVQLALEEPLDELNSLLPGLPGWPMQHSIPSEKEEFAHWLSKVTYPEEMLAKLIGKAETSTRPFFNPEIEFLSIQGKTKQKNSDQAIKNQKVCINFLSSNYFNSTESDSSGYFNFVLPDSLSTIDYMVSFTHSADPNQEIKVFSQFDEPITMPNAPFFMTDAELTFLRERNTYLQLNSIFNPDLNVSSTKTAADAMWKVFFSPPDYSVNTADYIALANIQEIIYEVVPNVMVRTIDQKEHIRVYQDTDMGMGYEPLILLDGIPILDHAPLLALSTDRIQTIEVKNKIYVHGNQIYSAVVNFVSKNRDYAGLELPSSSKMGSLAVPSESHIIPIKKADQAKNIPNLQALLYKAFLPISQKNAEIRSNDLLGSFSFECIVWDENGHLLLGTARLRVQ